MEHLNYQLSETKIRIFIVYNERKYGIIVKDTNNILIIREIENRYDFANAVLAIHPDAIEKSMYIKVFEELHPELALKLLEFINK